MSQFAKFAPFATITLGLLLLAAVGCNQSPGLDAKTVTAYRTSFTLAEEPDGVQTVGDIRSTLLGEREDVHDHDHDGDGIQDHAAADHDEDAHEDHEDHDEEGEGHEDHDEEGEGHEEGDDHDEDGEDHEEGEDHDEDGDDHEGHDEEHGHEAHEAHDDHEHHAHATESMNVVMVGHIGGLANPWAKTVPEFPFAKTKAIFYLADPLAIAEHAEHAHEHSHAPGEECAFCSAHAEDQADMLAMVQFVDKNGKVLPVDVRQLFEVKEKDMVVVSGKARVTAGGILVVDAEGIYVRN